jgi:hypothetical protein
MHSVHSSVMQPARVIFNMRRAVLGMVRPTTIASSSRDRLKLPTSASWPTLANSGLWTGPIPSIMAAQKPRLPCLHRMLRTSMPPGTEPSKSPWTCPTFLAPISPTSGTTSRCYHANRAQLVKQDHEEEQDVVLMILLREQEEGADYLSVCGRITESLCLYARHHCGYSHKPT